ncbi:MAG: hypothetical protein COB02_09470 [Candidatus Cloacimonadota bacterium]|nr:MAG: hypothetical protein COB02_09470 [Candidatus Cloacimonadota bacterium]
MRLLIIFIFLQFQFLCCDSPIENNKEWRFLSLKKSSVTSFYQNNPEADVLITYLNSQYQISPRVSSIDYSSYTSFENIDESLGYWIKISKNIAIKFASTPIIKISSFLPSWHMINGNGETIETFFTNHQEVSKVYSFEDNSWLDSTINEKREIKKGFTHLTKNKSYWIRSDYRYHISKQVSFNQARKNHTMLVDNSKVFVLGGESSGVVSDSVESFSFQFHLWTHLPNLINARYDHSSVIYKNKIYVYGGLSSTNQDLSSLEYFDVQTSSVWQEVVNSNQLRSGHNAIVDKDKMYILSGFSSINNSGSLTNEIISYNFLTNKWKSEAFGGNIRIHHQSILIDNKIYIIGGTSKVFDVYDLTSKDFTKESKLNFFRMHHQLYYFNEKIYVIGGENEQGNFYESIWAYSLKTKSWDYDVTHFSKLSKFSLFEYENKLFISGGENSSRLENSDFEIVSLDAINNTTNNSQVQISILTTTYNVGLLGLNLNSFDIDSDLYYESSLSFQINSSSSDGFIKTSNVDSNSKLLTLKNNQLINWSSLLDLNKDYDNVWLKLQSSDGQGNAESTIVTGPISIYNGWPQVTSVQTKNSSSDINITYQLADIDADLLSVKFEYSVDNGFLWKPSINISGVLASLSMTKTHQLTWHSFLDIQGDFNFIKIRLSPSDNKTRFQSNLVSKSLEVFNGINQVPKVKNINLLGLKEAKNLLLRPKFDLNQQIIGSEYSLDQGTSWLISSYTHSGLLTTKTFEYIEIKTFIKDSDKHLVDLDLRWKQSTNNNWANINGIISSVNNIKSETEVSLIWLSSVDISETLSNVQISLKANDYHLGESSYFESLNFEIYNANVRPQVIIASSINIPIESVSSLLEQDGITSFVVSIKDSDSNTFELELFYSFDEINYIEASDELISGNNTSITTTSPETISWLSALNVKLNKDIIHLKMRVFDQKQYSSDVYLSLDLKETRYDLINNEISILSGRAFQSGFDRNGLWHQIGGRNSSGFTTSILQIVFPNFEVEQLTTPYNNSNFSASYLNNKAYLYGGLSQDSSKLSTVLNILNFSTNPETIETNIGGLQTRIDHSAVWYQDSLYYFGGQSLDGVLSSLEVYNPSTGWSVKTSSPSPRYGHQSLLYKNKMWVFGGFTSRDSLILATSEILIYDFEKDTWSNISSDISPKAFFSAKLWNNKVILAGGIQEGKVTIIDSLASLDYINKDNLSQNIEEFNLLTFSTQMLAKPNKVYIFHDSIIKNNTLYNFGGLNENSQTLNTLSSILLKDKLTISSNHPSYIKENKISGVNSKISLNFKIFDADILDKSFVNLSYSTDNFKSFHKIYKNAFIGQSTKLSSNITHTLIWDTLKSLPKLDFTSLTLKYVVKDSLLGTSNVSYSPQFSLFNSDSTSPIISNLSRINNRDQINLSFDLLDVDNDLMKVTLDYSLDGINFQKAKLANTKNLYSSRNSILITWTSLDDINFTTSIYLRLNADDRHIASSTKSSLSSFILQNGETLPKITSLEINGSRFDIDISCHLSDDSSLASNLGLKLLYSLDGVHFIKSESIDNIIITSNDTDLKFVWHSLKDIISDESVVYIKVLAFDEVGDGKALQSDVFQINNNNWTIDFTLKKPRTNHSTITYENKIYIWGGQDKQGNILNSLEVYDPNSGEWKLFKSGGIKRMNHSAVLHKAKIYFWGGENSDGRLNSTDVYDILNNTWSIKQEGGSLRTKHSAHLYKNKIYYFGGREFGSNRYNTVDVYNINTDTFSINLSGGHGRDAHVSALINDKVYLFGGLGQNGFEDSIDVFEFLPWRTINTNIDRSNHSSIVTSNGLIYIIGGENSSNLVTNSIDIYKITSTDLILQNTYYFNNARKNHSSILLENNIYIIGGENGNTAVNEIEKFNLSSKTNSIVSTLETSFISAKSINYLTSIYLFGGLQNDKNIYKYSVSQNTLTSESLLLTHARTSFSATLIDDKVYIIGGVNNSTDLNSMDIVSLKDMTLTNTTLPIAISSHVAEFWNNNLYLNGGVSQGVEQNKLWSFSIKNQTWQNDLVNTNFHKNASSISYKDKMYILGGKNSTNQLQNIVSTYSQWRSIIATSIKRSDASGVVIDDNWYIFGGNNTNFNNDLLVFDSNSETFETGDSGGIAKQNSSANLIEDQVIFVGGTSSVGVSNKIEHYTIPKKSSEKLSAFTSIASYINIGLSDFNYAKSTKLNNDIYLSGGVNSIYLSQFILIDSDSYKLSIKASMPIALSNHSMANNNKDVYLFGGENQSGLSNKSYKYEIDSDSFKSLKQLKVARKNHTSTFYNSNIYLYGGETSSSISSGIEIYNIKQDSWVKRSSKIKSRTNHSANLYNGRIYFIGGKVSVGVSLVPTSSMLIYFISANKWVEAPSLDFSIYNHSSVINDNKIYVYGGLDKNNQTNNLLRIYDLEKNIWSNSLNLAFNGRHKHTSFIDNSKIISVGGISSQTNNKLLEIIQLDFVGGSYRGEIKNTVSKRYGHNIVAYEDSIYVFGGISDNKNKTDIYHQDLKLWTSLDIHPSEGEGASIAIKDGSIYRWGGKSIKTLDQIETWSLPLSGSLISKEVSGIEKKSNYSVNYIDDKIFFVGGSQSASKLSSNISVYDIKNSQWEKSIEINIAKNSHCSFVKETSTLLILGGENTSGIQTNAIEILNYSTKEKLNFDNSSDIFGFDAISLRSGAVCEQLTNVAYIIGGVQKSPSSTTYLSSVYELNLDTMSLSLLSPINDSFAYSSHSIYENKIYIYGGEKDSKKLNSFYLFDTINKTWSTLSSNEIARSRHSSAIISHYLFIFGGETILGVTNKIDVYDLKNSTWLGNTLNGEIRSNFKAVKVNKAVLLYGGVVQNKISDSLEKLSLENKEASEISGEFQTNVNLLVTLSEHSSVVLSDESIIVFGGYENNPSTLNTNLYRFDSIDKTWTNTKDTISPLPRRAHTSNYQKNKMYSWGGYLSNGAINNRMSVYNTLTKTWSEAISGGTSRALHSADLSNGKIYFTGGNDDSLNINSITSHLDIFTLDTWQDIKVLSTNLSEYAMNISSDQLYIWGGVTNSISQNNLLIYDFSKKSEQDGIDGGSARRDHCSILYDDKIFYWGGFSGSGSVNTMDIYDIKDKIWKVGTEGGTGRQSHDCVSNNKYMYAWGGEKNGAIVLDFDRYTLNPFHKLNLGVNPRVGALALVHDSVAYIYGGTSSSALDTMDTLSSNGNSFILTQNVHSSSNKKYHHAGLAKDNLFYYYGGINENGDFLKTLEIFDPVNKVWDSTKPSGLSSLAGSTLLDNGTSIFVLGGEFLDGTINQTLLKYRIDINQWINAITIQSPIISRSYHSSLVISNVAYVFGGRRKQGAEKVFTNLFEAFNLNDQTKTPVTAMTGSARAFHQSFFYDGSIYIYGGIDNEGNIIDTVDRYRLAISGNPGVPDKWFLGIDIGDPRTFSDIRAKSAGFFMNNKYYLYGGMDSSNVISNNLISYDPVRWIKLLAGPSPKIGVLGEHYQNKIYFWGGKTSASNTDNRMELYDIDSNTWALKNSGGNPRYNASSTIDDDKIVYFGGRTGSNQTTPNTAIASVDIYNITKDRWLVGSENKNSKEKHKIEKYKDSFITWGGLENGVSTTSSMIESFLINPWSQGTPTPIKIKLHSSASKGGVIYTYGGLDENANTLNNLLSYNIVLDSWKTLDSEGDFRHSHKGAIFQNRFYNFGGESSSTILSSIDIFDIGSDSWISGFSGGDGRKSYSISVKDSSIQLIGGVNSNNITTSSYDDYQISVSNLGWKTSTFTGLKRSYGSLVEAENKLYLFGGLDHLNESKNDFMIYDLSTKLSTVLTSPFSKRFGHSVARYKDKLIYFGGNSSLGSSNQLFSFDISSHTWAHLNNDGDKRFYHQSRIKNGILNLFGGENEEGIFSTINRYDLITSKWLSSRFSIYSRTKQGFFGKDSRSFLFGGESVEGFGNNSLEYYDHDKIDKNNSPEIISAQIDTDNSKLHKIRFNLNIKDLDKDAMSISIFYSINNTKEYYPIVYSHLDGKTKGLIDGNYIITWSSVKDLSLDNQVTTLNFRVKISDGIDSITKDINSYNVSSFTSVVFNNLPRFFEKKSSHTSTLVNGVIYLFGGFTEQGSPSATLKQYFINDNNWLLDLIDAPHFRAEHSASYINEKIYYFGGIGVSGARNDFSVYNVIPVNEWINGDTPSATARRRHSSVVVGNNIWMIGGRVSGGLTNSIEVYNTISQLWTNQDSQATAREYHESFVYNNKIYIIGGIDTNEDFVLEPDIYDITTQEWSKGESAPYGLKYQSSVLWEDKIVMLGGSKLKVGETIHDGILIYNINEDTWTSTLYSGEARKNASTILLNGSIDSIFIIGGESSSQLDSIDRFNLGK